MDAGKIAGIEVLATAGDTTLGGDDFDKVLGAKNQELHQPCRLVKSVPIQGWRSPHLLLDTMHSFYLHKNWYPMYSQPI